MKKTGKNRVSKGAPSGLVVSLLLHVAAFFIAGLFVVFTVVTKKDPEFVPPPPVERPKMQLKKPKVKVQKSSNPKPSSRIVAKVKTRDMPEIMLPDLEGTGEGLLGGVGVGGEFMELPEIGEMSLFGGGVTSGNDLEVTFYCMKRHANGSVNTSMAHKEYFNILKRFVDSGWNTALLKRYYHSPTKLYATTVFIPIVTSCMGPVAFGESYEDAACWAAHYRGKLVHKDGITFRFWGVSDDVLTVAIDKKVVLAANFPWDGVDAYTIAQEWWGNEAPGSRGILDDAGSYKMADSVMVGSSWITLEPGVAHDFDAVAGEGPGGEFYAMLMVEVQGEKYPLNEYGQPMFPVFALEPLSWGLQDSILMNLYKDEANVTNVTTYFNDL
ncbi:MAG: hypothetical protein JXR25_17100 [Pontiellaceae bacterium]|nr:hypothetical protein [Pontiellaceae bacterium]